MNHFNDWSARVAPSTAPLAQRVADGMIAARDYLGIPSWRDYQSIVTTAARDAWTASGSSTKLLVVTLKPLSMLLWFLLRLAWQGLQQVAGPVLQKAAVQLYLSFVKLAKWQANLSAREWLIEAAVLSALWIVYQLYRFLLRQTYTRRLKLWMRRQKMKLGRVYTTSRNRLITVSLQFRWRRVVEFGCDTKDGSECLFCVPRL